MNNNSFCIYPILTVCIFLCISCGKESPTKHESLKARTCDFNNSLIIENERKLVPLNHYLIRKFCIKPSQHGYAWTQLYGKGETYRMDTFYIQSISISDDTALVSINRFVHNFPLDKGLTDTWMLCQEAWEYTEDTWILIGERNKSSSWGRLIKRAKNK